MVYPDDYQAGWQERLGTADMKGLFSLLMLCFTSTGWAQAPLHDLGTYGPTFDVSNYVMRLVNSRSPHKTAARVVKRASRFPVESPGINSGAFESKAVDLPQLATPICIVGPDQYSMEWIERYRDILVASRATCIVTNVATAAAVDSIKAHLAVPAFAAAVNQLLEPLGVSRYPVLLSQTMVEQ